MPVEDVRSVLQALVDSDFGRWESADKNKCLVTWRSMTDWANAIYQWADSNGLMDGVSTVYELRAGEESFNAEFHGLDESIIVQALKVLEKEDKVTLLPGGSLDEMGVKFHSRS